MFEKEADEYRKNRKEQLINDDEFELLDNFDLNVGIAFKDGAEFGYNKANEWHYVKDGDLPKDENDVLVYSGEDWRMCVGRYSPKYKSWEAGCDAIAWKEITLPELKVQK